MAETIAYKVSSPNLKAFEDVKSEFLESDFIDFGRQINRKKKRNLSILRRERVINDSAILTAVKNGYWSDTLNLLKFYGTKYNILFPDYHGYDVLYYSQSNLELFTYILENNRNERVFNRTYPSGETVFEILIKHKMEDLILDNFHLFSYNLLNKSDSMNRTTLIMACRNCLYTLCKKLITSGVSVYQYDIEGKNMAYYLIENLSLEGTTSFALWFFHYKHNKQIYEPFHRFYEDDVIVYNRIWNSNKGSNYSVIYHGYDKKTSNTIVLKKCIKYKPFDIISPDIIKEIIFLLNLKKENVNVVRILGYYINSLDEFYLVFEPLAITLYDYFKILREINSNLVLSPPSSPQRTISKRYSVFNTIDESPNYVEEIYSKVMESITQIHKLGILHNDLKLENIMLNYNGKIKIIDFGIADFFGISPNKSVLHNYISSSFIKAPDEFHKIQYEVCNSSEVPQGKLTYENNRKSYDSDMYSFGNSMIQGIFGSTSKYLILNSLFYKVITPKDHKQLQKLIPLSVNRVKKLESYSFFGRLKLMIDINCNKRTPRVKLNLNVKKYTIAKKHIVLNNIHYTDDEISGQQRELIYINDICSNYNNVFFEVNQVKDLQDIISRLVTRYKSKISYDTIINTLYYSNNCTIDTQFNDYVVICFFYIFSSIFETNIYDSNDVSELICKNNNHMIAFVNDLILKNISTIPIISFVSVVASKVVELQKDNKDGIQQIEIDLYKKIVANMNIVNNRFSLNQILP